MVIGHHTQWKFLTKAAELNRLSHAYLFCGQEQLGKKTLAIEFAKLLNCSSENFAKRPCQNCRNCQEIQKRIHPDFILVEPEVPSKQIQISQVRDLIWKLSLRSYSAPYKIAILDKAHLMTKDSQGCFLKLLEEPQGKTLLILLSEHPEILLPTIISRIQKVKFFPVKTTEIENYFALQGVEQEKASSFASMSSGRPGAAINFSLDSAKIENQKKLISDFIKISRADLSTRFQYAKNLLDNNSANSPGNLQEILNTWARYLRGILLSRLYQEKSDSLGSFEKYSISQLSKFISFLQSTNFLVSSTNINHKLALEVLLMKL